MGELPSRESLEMSLLLFTLISTALVTPTRWDARCLRSALLRETSAHSSVHMSSIPLRICYVQLSWTRRRKRLRDPYELYHGGLGCGRGVPIRLSTSQAPPLRICHVQLCWTRRRNGLRDSYELYHGRLGCG